MLRVTFASFNNCLGMKQMTVTYPLNMAFHVGILYISNRRYVCTGSVLYFCFLFLFSIPSIPCPSSFPLQCILVEGAHDDHHIEEYGFCHTLMLANPHRMLMRSNRNKFPLQFLEEMMIGTVSEWKQQIRILEESYWQLIF